MFNAPKAQFEEKDLLPTWQYLIKTEHQLNRNVLLCRIIQPVGAVLFLFNLLLTSFNLILYFLDETIATYFMDLPILPSLVEAMPRESLSGALVYLFVLSFIVPLGICGLIFGGIYLYRNYKHPEVEQPLHGTLAQRAQAATNKAENIYELRKKIPQWSIYLETGILTVLTAVPLVLMFIDYASDGAMALTLVLIILALLVALFLLFWVYALLFTVFSRLNALYYFSPSEWKLYGLYHQLDAYWATVDPAECARRKGKN